MVFSKSLANKTNLFSSFHKLKDILHCRPLYSRNNVNFHSSFYAKIPSRLKIYRLIFWAVCFLEFLLDWMQDSLYMEFYQWSFSDEVLSRRKLCQVQHPSVRTSTILGKSNIGDRNLATVLLRTVYWNNSRTFPAFLLLYFYSCCFQQPSLNVTLLLVNLNSISSRHVATPHSINLYYQNFQKVFCEMEFYRRGNCVRCNIQM